MTNRHIFWAPALLSLSAANVFAAQVIDFEDINIAADSYWAGTQSPAPSGSSSTQFNSGDATFTNDFTWTTSFSFWGGWAVSSKTDTTTPGLGNQYSAFTGSGYQSSNYGIAFGSAPVQFATSSVVEGAYFTNTTYAGLSMTDGDFFAKKFGGTDGNDPDWFKLTITGKDAQQNATGTVDFYLADFRFADNQQDYIVDSWAWVDLSALGAINSIEFALSSSDVGSFGMNTPGYFALDKLEVSAVPVPAAAWLMGSALLGLFGYRKKIS